METDMAKHQFLAGNKHSVGKGRPPGSGFTKQFRDTVGTNQFQELIRSIIDRAMNGDMSAAAILVNRLVPPLKATAEPIRVQLPDTSHAEMARALLGAVSHGQIAPAEAKTVMELITATVALEQVEALSRRIDALEGSSAHSEC
jgi:hypothetical protein